MEVFILNILTFVYVIVVAAVPFLVIFANNVHYVHPGWHTTYLVSGILAGVTTFSCLEALKDLTVAGIL
jgi:branched-subunit amino acid transport protein